MLRKYHVGLYKHDRTMIIQACSNIDNLNCETTDYFGIKTTTKKILRENRYHILDEMKNRKPGIYGSVRYATVE